MFAAPPSACVLVGQCGAVCVCQNEILNNMFAACCRRVWGMDVLGLGGIFRISPSCAGDISIFALLQIETFWLVFRSCAFCFGLFYRAIVIAF